MTARVGSYDDFFQRVTGNRPFPYQRAFAETERLPELVRVPTGLGKTAMVVVGWLWRRLAANERLKAATPRRLVYCLPMRVLVEQTAENAREWVRRLELNERELAVHVLMGGERLDKEWDLFPERDAILVGTQDMLLSRALNRGYAASRARWPMQFGMLHTECLWVFDEIQLMGAGLATTAQLEAFRRRWDGHGCATVWMSATMQRDWLETVDSAPFLQDAQELSFDFRREMSATGLHPAARKTLETRWKARKTIAKSGCTIGEAATLAEEVRDTHRAGTRTIVVMNTVKRARALFAALQRRPKRSNKGTAPVADQRPKVVLLHSRFRPTDRNRQVQEAIRPISESSPGAIVVSTQVIEAGVDVSCSTLFTEVAPWASLVQRFGRCNRAGSDEGARVVWIDLPTGSDSAGKSAVPYQLEDLEFSRKRLKGLKDAGVASLPPTHLPFEHGHVIRNKDMLDLFDTTPDLAGNDIDIDRFVREVEESDVRVFWRRWHQPKGTERPQETDPAREELCPAPIGEFRDLVKRAGRGKAWRWDSLDDQWEEVRAQVAPGQVYLVHSDAGGYSPERGWDPEVKNSVDPIPTNGEPPDANSTDPSSKGKWRSIAMHADDVCREIDAMLGALPHARGYAEALSHAARWHDRGKAHEVFQGVLPGRDVSTIWAKAPKGQWGHPYCRKHFRHELASALAVLASPNGLVPPCDRDLIAYLVVAHHGKIRLSIRSLPDERRPSDGRRFARGIWEGDPLPPTDLGSGVNAPAVVLSLEPMELGLCEEGPFAGQPSWLERTIRLRDRLGPFRLAYLEAVLRAADMRASRAAEAVS